MLYGGTIVVSWFISMIKFPACYYRVCSMTQLRGVETVM